MNEIIVDNFAGGGGAIIDEAKQYLQQCPPHVRERRAAHVIEKLIAALEERSQTMDLIAHLKRQKEFSLKTFGPGLRTAGVCDHIRKELAEIEADPDDLSEWVDVILLALDGAWRTRCTPEQIASAIEEKQIKNENRIWPDWRTADPNKAIEHVRALDLPDFNLMKDNT
jgi:Protein of unknown function (DUF550)